MRNRRRFQQLKTVTLLTVLAASTLASRAGQIIDFNTDIRSLLSENCYRCHGPDPAERKGPDGGLRLDTLEGARRDLGGYRAITPGNPGQSELLKRVTTSDPDDRMPPPEAGKQLTSQQVLLLKQWIEQGATYAEHWSYATPTRPPLPRIQKKDWPRNPIDHFILSRLETDNLQPSEPASPHAIVRRVSLDLTGLPPTLEEVDQFVSDPAPDAYAQLVERLLNKKSFGEHWARMWLDQARYADSSGYADDPERTIWAFRDYVIRSFNSNKRFDQFTLEQIAGDLLDQPTEEQLIATAFHRNTLTNNEGGTNDEEYRNVAVVDRVNTTMAVWMGTTMACAQCHTHKYDPLTQKEYFSLFAILNNTADADRRDESPFLELYSEEQKQEKRQLTELVASLKKTLSTMTPELKTAHDAWTREFGAELEWNILRPTGSRSRENAGITIDDNSVISVAQSGETDSLTLDIQLDSPTTLNALRLQTLPSDSLPGQGAGHGGGNFIISEINASLIPPDGTRTQGRFVRIQLPGKSKMLSLAEVQVFNAGENIALKGEASQSSTGFDGPARLAIDGNTDGDYNTAKSTTHTAESDDPWFELDLKADQPVDRVVIWNRTDNNLQGRLSNYHIALLNEKRETVWERTVAKPPTNSAEFSPGGTRSISFTAAYADYSQKDFPASSLIDNRDLENKGWAVGGAHQQPHFLTLIPSSTVEAPAGSTLQIQIRQLSKHKHHTLGRFQLARSADPRAVTYSRTPPAILALLNKPGEQRSADEHAEIQRHFLSIAPQLQNQRDELDRTEKRLSGIKPYTTVPILGELEKEKRRVTHLQHRGNFLDTGEVTEPGLPSAFHQPPEDAPPNRLTLARWLVDRNNPLTPRVVANRFWESLFGIGLVRTSEEFGSQGERPSHPELLDWLATELVASGWDTKHLLKLMVTSAAYRQSSRVTPELLELDPDNRLLARGPRFRLSAEMIRDQALFVSGLMSPKMYGPPVNPLQPEVGLTAAFGSGIDWKTSNGEDRYRRGLYTTWRRSNPYPSMAAFDAPNREVCTVRRERTNTPLQALVTLNDPVYIEAAQALGRRMATAASTPADRARHGFRLCLSRPPTGPELNSLTHLYETARDQFGSDPDQAKIMATDPIGPLPEGMDAIDLAAWTMVGNVLLNLDEVVMKR